MENNCCTNCTGDKEFPNTCTDPTCVCHVTPPEGGKIIAGLNHQSSDANGTTTSPRPESEPLQDVSLAEWEKRGYRIIPKEIDDLDLDWEGEHNAKRDGKWTITILKEEADLLISSLLSAREAEAYLRGKNERGIAVMGLEIDYEKKIEQAEARVREEYRKELVGRVDALKDKSEPILTTSDCCDEKEIRTRLKTVGTIICMHGNMHHYQIQIRKQIHNETLDEVLALLTPEPSKEKAAQTNEEKG